MSLRLQGIGVSPGIAIGRVHLLTRSDPEIARQRITARQVPVEIRRFRTALETARAQLRGLRETIPAGAPPDVAEFIDTHLLMLADHLLTEGVEEIIRTRRCNAEWALGLLHDQIVSVFDQMEDPYLRTRQDDVAYVIHRVQRLLALEGDSAHAVPGSLRRCIVVADELAPEEVAMLHGAGVIGVITRYGGPLAHTAILVRSLGLVGVMGVHDAPDRLQEGEVVVLDGDQGVVLAGASATLVSGYRRRQREIRQRHRALEALRPLAAMSLDGQRITLEANIEVDADLRALREVGAEGVGLYRTEFLYLDRDGPPDEEEQLKTYTRVIRALRGYPLTIRTLDLGADKRFAADPDAPGAGAINPALGLRAIRYSLSKPGLFVTQLRAILRASALGPVRMMLPMLTHPGELDQVMGLLQLCRGALAREGLAFDPDMPVGGMMETPAAALGAEAFARRLDFLSIGTNDLIQYTLAIDRSDDEVNYLYDPGHPAVLQLIDRVLRAGQRTDTPVTMCGEMAGDTRYTRLLLGLGLRTFSVRPDSLPEIKCIVRDTDIAEIRGRCRRLLRCQDADAVRRALDRLNQGGCSSAAFPPPPRRRPAGP